MNFLVIDPEVCGLDLAYRAATSGHTVRWWTPLSPKGQMRPDGKGFPGVTRVDDWRKHMIWAKEGLVWITHNTEHLKELMKWRALGWPVLAPSPESARLEVSRAEGMKAFAAAGIPVPEYKTFATLAEAERSARGSDRPWVFKTMGDEEDKSLSYVADDPAELVGWLARQQKNGLRLAGPCMLQEKVEGIEIGVSGWMGPQGFLPKRWNVNFEHKRLMSGDYGPNTGEQGTVIAYEERSKLADWVLAPLERKLIELKHLGDVDVNCIVDTAHGRVYPLEWTTRPGWPFTQIVQASHRGDPIQWMRDLVKGKASLEVSTDPAVGCVVPIPPYPKEVEPREEAELVGLPIRGTEKVWAHVHPWQMMIAKGPTMKDGHVVEADTYQTTGAYVMVVSGTGSNVREARAACYDALKRIKVPDMMVRDDIGAALEPKLKDLHDQGFALGVHF